MKPRLVFAIAAVALLAGVGWFYLGHEPGGRPGQYPTIDRDTMRVVPDTLRIRVELLNATGERGLARRAMRYFRDRGFDVVSVGNASERVDSSVVLNRTGHAAWAELAVRAAGSARIETRPDTSRYLDLTILLGSSFRPLPHILYP
jgi:hypothetical protein